MPTNQVRGVAPGLVLFPAREYVWELVRRVSIKVPNSGDLKKLVGDKKFQDGIQLFDEESEFVIFYDGLIQLWQLVRTLFATAQYPDLKDDECLNVIAIEQAWEAEIGEVLTLHCEIIRTV